MVARGLLLLVRALVLLVHDDDTEVRQRRKDRAARPDRDTGLAAREFHPLLAALPFREVTVQHGHTGRTRTRMVKSGAEAFHRLRGEGDFGHQNQCAFP